MYARYLNAPLLLLLWQLAPLDVKTDRTGKLRLDFGAGTGFYRYLHSTGVGCSGEPVELTTPAKYSSKAISAEAWASDAVRVRGAFGSVTDETGALNGLLGGAMVSLEQKRFGVGIGVSSFSGTDGSWAPAVALRAGPLDGPHLRADYGFPGANLGLLGRPRVGLGLNQGTHRGLRLFVGGTVSPAADSSRSVGLFAEAGLPFGFLQQRAGMSLLAFLSGHSEGRQMYSLGLGFFVQP